MEKNWIKIVSSTDFFKVELLRQALIEQDIPAVLLNKKDSSYGFGQVELYVDSSDQAMAVAVIEEMNEER